MAGRATAARIRLAGAASVIIVGLALTGWAVVTFQGAGADQLSARQGVRLATDRLAYPIGAPVRLTLRNQSRQVLMLPGSSPFSIERAGEVLYQPFDDPTPIELGPGQDRSWEWAQRDALGDAIPAGTYEVAAAYAEGQTESIARATLVILPASTLPLGFEVAPTVGSTPLTVTLRCPASQAPVVADFGDNSDSELLADCPATLQHTYTEIGTFSLALRSGGDSLGAQPITVGAPAAVEE